MSTTADVVREAMTLSGLYNEIHDHTKPENEITYSNFNNQEIVTSKTLQDPRRAIPLKSRSTFTSESSPNTTETGQFRFASELPHQGLQSLYYNYPQASGENFISLPYQPQSSVDIFNNLDYKNRELCHNSFDTTYRQHHYRGRNNRGKYDSRNYCNPNSKYQNHYGKHFHRPYNRRGRGYAKFHDFSNRNEFTFPEYMQRDQSYDSYNSDFRHNPYRDNYQQLCPNYGFQSRDYSMAFSQIPSSSMITDSQNLQKECISSGLTLSKKSEYSQNTPIQTNHKETKLISNVNNLEKPARKKTDKDKTPQTEDVVSLSYIPSSHKMDLIKRIYNADIVPLAKDSLSSTSDVDKCKYNKSSQEKTFIKARTRPSTSKEKQITSTTDSKHCPNLDKGSSNLKKKDKSPDEAIENLRKLSKLEPMLSPLPLTPKPDVQESNQRAPTKLINFKRLLEKNDKDISASDIEFIKQSSRCTVSTALNCNSSTVFSDTKCTGKNSYRVGRPRQAKTTVNSKIDAKDNDFEGKVTAPCNIPSIDNPPVESEKSNTTDSMCNDNLTQRTRSDSSSTEEGQYKSPVNDYSQSEVEHVHSIENQHMEQIISQTTDEIAQNFVSPEQEFLAKSDTENGLFEFFDNELQCTQNSSETKKFPISDRSMSPKSTRSSSSDSDTDTSSSSSSSSSKCSCKSSSSASSKNSVLSRNSCSSTELKPSYTESPNSNGNRQCDFVSKVDMSEFEFRCGKELNLYKHVESRLQLDQNNEHLYNPRFRPHIRKKRPPSTESESDTNSDLQSQSFSSSKKRRHEHRNTESESCSESTKTRHRQKHRSRSSSDTSRSRSASKSRTCKVCSNNKQDSQSETQCKHLISISRSNSEHSISESTYQSCKNKNSETLRSRSRSSESDCKKRSERSCSNHSWSSGSTQKSKRVDIDFTHGAKSIPNEYEQKKSTNKFFKNKRRNARKRFSDDSDSSMQLFYKKRISGTQKSDSELSDNDLSYREYVKLQEQKQSAKFKVQRGRVPTKDFEKLFRKTIRAFEYKQIPKKPFPEAKLKESVYALCCNGSSKSGALIIYFTRSKTVAEDIKAMQKELMVRPNITMSEPFKMNHAPPRYYDKDSIKNFIELQKKGPHELWENISNSAHTLYTRHSDLKTIIIYAATPIDFFMAAKICNNYAKKRPKEIVLRLSSITDGDNPISIYNPVSRDFLSKYTALCKF